MSLGTSVMTLAAYDEPTTLAERGLDGTSRVCQNPDDATSASKVCRLQQRHGDSPP